MKDRNIIQVMWVRGWGYMKKGKEGGHDCSTSYTCMNWNHIETCGRHFKKNNGRKGRLKEGDEPNCGTAYLYMETKSPE
jgi:hypothetical protein